MNSLSPEMKVATRAYLGQMQFTRMMVDLTQIKQLREGIRQRVSPTMMTTVSTKNNREGIITIQESRTVEPVITLTGFQYGNEDPILTFVFLARSGDVYRDNAIFDLRREDKVCVFAPDRLIDPRDLIGQNAELMMLQSLSRLSNSAKRRVREWLNLNMTLRRPVPERVRAIMLENLPNLLPTQEK